MITAMLTFYISIIGHQATQVAFKNCTIYKMYHKNWWNNNRWYWWFRFSVQQSIIYNNIDYSSNYAETTLSLWFYSKVEATDFNADIANDNNFKSFKYKAKILGNTEADNAIGILKDVTSVFALKYLSNFWRSLEMPLINCKAES